MPLETANFISELNPEWPLGSEPRAVSDDHHRLQKRVQQSQWPNLGPAAVTRTAAQLNQIGVTQPAGDNTTAPASTAFVQRAIADLNALSGAIVWSASSSASILLAAGQGVLGTNAGQITYTLPAAPAVIGQIVAVAPMNGRYDNQVAFGANRHMGIADAVMVLNAKDPTVSFVWTGAAFGWKLA